MVSLCRIEDFKTFSRRCVKHSKCPGHEHTALTLSPLASQVPKRNSYAVGIRRVSTAQEASQARSRRALATSKTVALFAVSGIVVSIVVLVVAQTRPSDQPFHVWWRRFSWPMFLAWSMVGSYLMSCIVFAWQCLVVCARHAPTIFQDDAAFQHVLGTQQTCAHKVRSRRHSRTEQNAMEMSFDTWWSGSQNCWVRSRRHSRKEQNAMATSFDTWWSGSQNWWTPNAIDQDVMPDGTGSADTCAGPSCTRPKQTTPVKIRTLARFGMLAGTRAAKGDSPPAMHSVPAQTCACDGDEKGNLTDWRCTDQATAPPSQQIPQAAADSDHPSSSAPSSGPGQDAKPQMALSTCQIGDEPIKPMSARAQGKQPVKPAQAVTDASNSEQHGVSKGMSSRGTSADGSFSMAQLDEVHSVISDEISSTTYLSDDPKSGEGRRSELSEGAAGVQPDSSKSSQKEPSITHIADIGREASVKSRQTRSVRFGSCDSQEVEGPCSSSSAKKDERCTADYDASTRASLSEPDRKTQATQRRALRKASLLAGEHASAGLAAVSRPPRKARGTYRPKSSASAPMRKMSANSWLPGKGLKYLSPDQSISGQRMSVGTANRNQFGLPEPVAVVAHEGNSLSEHSPTLRDLRTLRQMTVRETVLELESEQSAAISSEWTNACRRPNRNSLRAAVRQTVLKQAWEKQSLNRARASRDSDFDEMKRSSVAMKDFKSFRKRTRRVPDKADEGPTLMRI